MSGDQPAVTREFVAQVHIGMRDRPYVLDADGTSYQLPAECVRLNGRSISVVADPVALTATPK